MSFIWNRVLISRFRSLSQFERGWEDCVSASRKNHLTRFDGPTTFSYYAFTRKYWWRSREVAFRARSRPQSSFSRYPACCKSLRHVECPVVLSPCLPPMTTKTVSYYHMPDLCTTELRYSYIIQAFEAHCYWLCLGLETFALALS